MSDAPTDYAYVGQQDAGTATTEYNATQFHIEQRLAQLRTATLVKVVSVTNTAGQLAKVGNVDVLPLVNQVDGQNNATPHTTVHNLCYFRYTGGKNAILIDPEVGDIGIAVFADRDISSVKANQDQSNPGSRRHHDFADGIFFGVPLSAKGNEVPQQYIRFTADGIEMADKNGNKIVFASGGIHITSSQVTNTGEVIRGYGTGDQVTLGQHKHPQGADSHGDTEQDTDAPKPGT